MVRSIRIIREINKILPEDDAILCWRAAVLRNGHNAKGISLLVSPLHEAYEYYSTCSSPTLLLLSLSVWMCVGTPPHLCYRWDTFLVVSFVVVVGPWHWHHCTILYTRLSPQQRQWHWQQAASDEWEVFSGRNTEPAFPSSLPINILGYATWILIRRRTDGGWRSLVVVGVHRRLMLLLAGHFFHHHVLLFDPHWLSDWLTLCCCGCCCSSVLTRPNHCHSFAYSWALEFFRVSSTISIAQIAVFCVCVCL